MNRFSSLTVAVFAAGTLAAAPAFAQDRHERRGRSESRSQSERGTANEGRREDRSNNGRVDSDRATTRAVPRRAERPAIVAPQGVRPQVIRPQVVRPYYDRPYNNRPYYNRPYDNRPYYNRPSYVRPYYAPRYVRPYYSRPYVFRPRVRLGFGVIVGYPVPYAYAYPYPVPVYGYAAPSAPVIVGPNSTQYGGVSLEISPSDASVYVDGAYAGLVEDFDGTQQTLTLSNGRHRIEITAPGYAPMTFDVDIYPGQIVPYQGNLQPGRY
jgi:hypothetical protein